MSDALVMITSDMCMAQYELTRLQAVRHGMPAEHLPCWRRAWTLHALMVIRCQDMLAVNFQAANDELPPEHAA